MSEELKRRWITAVIAIALVAFSLFAHTPVFLFTLALFVSVIGVWEASRLLGLDRLGLAISVLSTSGVLYCLSHSIWSRLFFFVMLPLLLQGISLFIDREPEIKSFFASLYLGIPLGAAVWIKTQHLEWFLVAVAGCVWAGDAAAYFAGRFFGKTPLNPVSPKKTVEGALAGLVVGSLFFALVVLIFLNWGVAKAVVAGLFINASGQLGDLFESYFKRKAGVKDSGFLFPGHGGVLDRIDSLLFALFMSLLFV